VQAGCDAGGRDDRRRDRIDIVVESLPDLAISRARISSPPSPLRRSWQWPAGTSAHADTRLDLRRFDLHAPVSRVINVSR
jgi:hypothetical protein